MSATVTDATQLIDQVIAHLNQAPHIDRAATDRAAAIAGEAAKTYFRQWFAYNHRANYDSVCKPYVDSITHSIAAAIRSAWHTCEDEADQIAGEALRAAITRGAGQ